MAKAIKQERKVREVVEHEEQVVLTLTPEEAQTLYDITCAIAGCPHQSRRKHTDAVATALRRGAGLKSGRVGLPADFDSEQHTIYFKDVSTI